MHFYTLQYAMDYIIDNQLMTPFTLWIYLDFLLQVRVLSLSLKTI